MRCKDFAAATNRVAVRRRYIPDASETSTEILPTDYADLHRFAVPDFLICDNLRNLWTKNESSFCSSNTPAVVSTFFDDADHDWADRWRSDRLAAARLGKRGLFSARHLHQPDQIDHRAARLLNDCRRNRRCRSVAK